MLGDGNKSSGSIIPLSMGSDVTQIGTSYVTCRGSLASKRTLQVKSCITADLGSQVSIAALKIGEVIMIQLGSKIGSIIYIYY